jgi:hypothetical protein
VHKPDGNYTKRSEKKCVEKVFDPCSVDIKKYREALQAAIDQDYIDPPLYCLGLMDCGWWTERIFDQAFDAAAGGGKCGAWSCGK